MSVDPAEIAAFVGEHVGSITSDVRRLDAFVTNEVYEVRAGERLFVVKATTNRRALWAEAWASAEAVSAGCCAPAVLGFGRLEGTGMSAFVMNRLPGVPIAEGHRAIRDMGAALARLHEKTLGGFGWLADASWADTDQPVLRARSWLEFLRDIVADTRALAGRYAMARSVAELAEMAVDSHLDALGAVVTGSLCHGDVKAKHVFVDGDDFVGLIDWGDAVVADPVWDIARFADRADPAWLSCMLNGYRDAGRFEEAWRVGLYRSLWVLVDAIVEDRLGSDVTGLLERAFKMFAAVGA